MALADLERRRLAADRVRLDPEASNTQEGMKKVAQGNIPNAADASPKSERSEGSTLAGRLRALFRASRRELRSADP